MEVGVYLLVFRTNDLPFLHVVSVFFDWNQPPMLDKGLGEAYRALAASTGSRAELANISCGDGGSASDL
jgi:hypothetical protein